MWSNLLYYVIGALVTLGLLWLATTQWWHSQFHHEDELHQMFRHTICRHCAEDALAVASGTEVFPS